MTFTEDETKDHSENLVLTESDDTLSIKNILRPATLPFPQKSGVNFDISNETPYTG